MRKCLRPVASGRQRVLLVVCYVHQQGCPEFSRGDWWATPVNQYTAGCGSAYAQSRRVDNESCSLSVMSTSKAVPSSVEGTGGLPQLTNILRGAEVLTPSRVG